jgi:Holliday junction resolvase
MVKEKEFWSWLRKYFDKQGVLYDRIEPTVPGTPDVWAIYHEKQRWIELKSESGYKINLRPEQKRWAISRTRAGATVFLLVKRITAKVNQLELMLMNREGEYVLIDIYPKLSGRYNVTKLIEDLFK